jgi:mannose-6-phosphate isomerase-like protein (cupin superfamily)
METINGCTLITPTEGAEPATFGPTEVDGAYRVLVGAIPANEPAPPFHVHPHTDEAFHIASGEASFLLGQREIRVTAGGFVFIPRGVPHTAWNSGDGPMFGLIMISPGHANHVFKPVADG